MCFWMFLCLAQYGSVWQSELESDFLQLTFWALNARKIRNSIETLVYWELCRPWHMFAWCASMDWTPSRFYRMACLGLTFTPTGICRQWYWSLSSMHELCHPQSRVDRCKQNSCECAPFHMICPSSNRVSWQLPRNSWTRVTIGIQQLSISYWPDSQD